MTVKATYPVNVIARLLDLTIRRVYQLTNEGVIPRLVGKPVGVRVPPSAPYWKQRGFRLIPEFPFHWKSPVGKSWGNSE